jgi:[protein-PII] uridylyltransferase
LFLGCLLHDIGKGLGGDHATLGAERARSCATRLGLDPERVERIVFLVAQHLHMAHLAQSRDLSDPKLIVGFAQLMEDRMRVGDLYLLTFADIRASSSQAWTDWKGQLLRELFERTSELMELGADAPSNAIELIERQVEERRAEAGAELEAMGVDPEASEQFFDMMPHRYFMAHGPDQIARHAVVVLKFDRGKPMSTAVRDMPGNFSEFILCAKDQHALYANVAGTLTAHNINILGSHVYTGRSGLALEVYRVSTPSGGEVAREQTWADIKESLEAILTGKIEARALLKQRGLPVGAKVPLAKTPASARIINDESDFYTIVEVRADDRLGLLHDLTRVIAGHGYEIYISKAATVLDQISDTFYLKDRNGKKLSDCAALEALRMELLRAVQRGVEGAGR